MPCLSPQPPARLLLPVLRFLQVEAASGVLLLLASLVALLWANSPWAASYRRLWQPDLLFLVNEGLMTGFFLLVGLELRRELHEGVLADLKAASLPIAAAFGGVLLPALIYLLCAPQARSGWAIPASTDIAFAATVLSLAASGAPLGLRRLLLTLAVADDIAALVIIAVFYSGQIDPLGLLIAAGGLLAHAALHRLGRGGLLTYLLTGVAIWLGLRQAGAHPTLAGVVLGLIAAPTATSAATSAAASAATAAAAQAEGTARLEAALHPWVAYLIIPLFALANAGVDLRGLPPATGIAWQVATGITAGLVLGKPLGILLGAALVLRARLTCLPHGLSAPHLALLGSLGGIGFTMSMFLANLAFTDPALLTTAKAAVVGGSVLAAALSILLGRLLPGIREPPPSRPVGGEP